MKRTIIVVQAANERMPIPSSAAREDSRSAHRFCGTGVTTGVELSACGSLGMRPPTGTGSDIRNRASGNGSPLKPRAASGPHSALG